MRTRRCPFVGLVAVAMAAATAAAPHMASAQAPVVGTWSLDARGGLGLPAGQLAEIQGTGPSIGAGFGYVLTPRVSLRLDLGLDLLPGENTFFENASLDAWHARAGAAYRLTDPVSNLFVDAGAGVGVTVLSFDDEALGSETDFSYELVGRIGHAISTNADIALRSALQFVDVTDDTWTIWQIQAVLQLWT